MHAIARFFRRDGAQELAEYCLITALVALIAGVILVHFSGGLQNIWSVANQTVNSGGGAASGVSAGSDVPKH